MGESPTLRQWSEMIPDVLGLIFSRLSLEEKLLVIPRVCKGWERVVAGPYSWGKIDLKEWAEDQGAKPAQLDRMIMMLVGRSNGSVTQLCVSGLATDSTFIFIAENASALKRLELQRCKIHNAVIEQCAPKFSNISVLDMSYCRNIDESVLEAVGNNCPSLVVLKKAMDPKDAFSKVCQDYEAYAIASTMPRLTCLDLSYSVLTTEAVIEILYGCRELEMLDIHGCWEVQLAKIPLDLVEKQPAIKVLGPYFDDGDDDDDPRPTIDQELHDDVWGRQYSYSDATPSSSDYGEDQDDDVWGFANYYQQSAEAREKLRKIF